MIFQCSSGSKMIRSFESTASITYSSDNHSFSNWTHLNELISLFLEKWVIQLSFWSLHCALEIYSTQLPTLKISKVIKILKFYFIIKKCLQLGWYFEAILAHRFSDSTDLSLFTQCGVKDKAPTQRNATWSQAGDAIKIILFHILCLWVVYYLEKPKSRNNFGPSSSRPKFFKIIHYLIDSSVVRVRWTRTTGVADTFIRPCPRTRSGHGHHKK